MGLLGWRLHAQRNLRAILAAVDAHLSVDLGLSTGSVHSLTHQDIHEEHLLLVGGNIL